uniref:Uncharacterized protein n=1 Tax=Romanomermis culicivorax TaxID=13658 RepID=A0A915KE55_ROMCU
MPVFWWNKTQTRFVKQKALLVSCLHEKQSSASRSFVPIVIYYYCYRSLLSRPHGLLASLIIVGINLNCPETQDSVLMEQGVVVQLDKRTSHPNAFLTPQ